MNKKYKVVTLGCRTNQYEAQAFQDQLQTAGYEAAGDGEQANVCIVNTCTVTESADSSSRNAVRRLVKENPGAEVIVTGCSAERQGEALASIPGVTRLVANKDKERLLHDSFPEEEFPEFSIQRFDAHTRAFVKVQDGCNSFCTYCIIPYVRGRSRSRTIPEVLSEVRQLVSNGYKEIVLTGINIGDFDGGEGTQPHTLAQLIRAVDAVDGVERIRVSSIDPDEVDDDLLDAIVNGRKTCQSMHIVLQAGSNVVLKRMNRKYTRQMFYQTVERLLAASPDFTFTTDVIVGFPGETEADFQETLEVVDEVRFAKVHMFPYSPRPRTRAATYTDPVPGDIARERKQRLLRHAERVGWELRDQYVGRTMTVLTEGRASSDNSLITGHTDNFLPVLLPAEGLQSNMLVEVELTKNTPLGFEATLLSAVPQSHPALRVIAS